MSHSATITAVNETAFTYKQIDAPSTASSTPATPEPMTRAPVIVAPLSPTALGMSAAGTSSAMKLWRVGVSNAIAQPINSDVTASTATVPWPFDTSSAVASATTAAATLARMRIRRLSVRSAIVPAQAPSTRSGRNCNATTIPRPVESPVSCNTIHPTAVVWTQVPMTESTCPTKKRR